ncbi:hypothetical protein B0H14DRAFT_2568165 [Mycena olivaceomarginata]|nr:hypothetical protein B0H14DRAFT_2568165 [Mycena olivaceomarginata]
MSNALTMHLHAPQRYFNAWKRAQRVTGTRRSTACQRDFCPKTAVILYYFDRVFGPCYVLLQVFTFQVFRSRLGLLRSAKVFISSNRRKTTSKECKKARMRVWFAQGMPRNLMPKAKLPPSTLLGRGQRKIGDPRATRGPFGKCTTTHLKRASTEKWKNFTTTQTANSSKWAVNEASTNGKTPGFAQGRDTCTQTYTLPVYLPIQSDGFPSEYDLIDIRNDRVMDLPQFFDALEKLVLAFGLDGELETSRLNPQPFCKYSSNSSYVVTLSTLRTSKFLPNFNWAFHSSKLVRWTLPINGIDDQSCGEETQGNIAAAWKWEWKWVWDVWATADPYLVPAPDLYIKAVQKLTKKELSPNTPAIDSPQATRPTDAGSPFLRAPPADGEMI